MQFHKVISFFRGRIREAIIGTGRTGESIKGTLKAKFFEYHIWLWIIHEWLLWLLLHCTWYHTKLFPTAKYIYNRHRTKQIHRMVQCQYLGRTDKSWKNFCICNFFLYSITIKCKKSDSSLVVSVSFPSNIWHMGWT